MHMLLFRYVVFVQIMLSPKFLFTKLASFEHSMVRNQALPSFMIVAPTACCNRKCEQKQTPTQQAVHTVTE